MVAAAKMKICQDSLLNNWKTTTGKVSFVTRLNRELIAREALKLMNEQGENALSMRALGARLGVSAMGLYTYFSSRDELVSAALELIRQEYDNAPIPGEFWEDTVRRITASIRDVNKKYANAYRALHGYEPAARGHARRIYQLHRDQGIPLEAYRPLYSMLEAYLGGFVSKEIDQLSATFEPIDPDDPDYEWMLIAEEAYNDYTFAGGISLIIKGMHLLDPEGAKTWRTPEDPSTWTWQ